MRSSRWNPQGRFLSREGWGMGSNVKWNASVTLNWRKKDCPHFYSTPTQLGRRCSEVLSPTQLRCEAGGQWVHNLLSMASHWLGEATEGTSEPSMSLKTETFLPCLQAWQKRPPPPQALGSAECCLCPRLPSQAWTCSVLLQVWLKCAHCTWKRKAQRKLNDELIF